MEKLNLREVDKVTRRQQQTGGKTQQEDFYYLRFWVHEEFSKVISEYAFNHGSDRSRQSFTRRVRINRLQQNDAESA